MAQKYYARKGGTLSNDQASALGRELEAMTEAGIPTDPHNVVARAQDPESPIHELFEWDDSKAAREYRVHQARTSISSIVVKDAETGSQGRAAFSVQIVESESVRREYVPRRVVIARDDYMDQVSRDLYQRIKSAVAEAEGLGLTKSSDAWGRMSDAVHGNQPVSLGK